MDSNLRATPIVGRPDIYVHVEISCDSFSLKAIRCVIWRDAVFVNSKGSTTGLNNVSRDLKTHRIDLKHHFISVAKTAFFH